ncbi:MAG: 16S rRNA (guanine(966)-N(2))-methyltransferase RsmD [Clostridia bacterium]|nr:16S rRNA (guanine(966)-N(2))-methyltransferase RsmD [Clostridia bacterium]
MRIIAGDFKGRKLQPPKDYSVRPTTDKVKEAVFSMLAPYVRDACVIDLFGGSGNLGLEALSRGAKKCYFGDNSRESIALIRSNVEYCRAQDRSVICPGDYKKVLASVRDKADIILLDPPYKMGLMEGCFEAIRENDLLAEDGVIVAEHGYREELPDLFEGYVKLKEKKYGSILVSVYGSREEE